MRTVLAAMIVLVTASTADRATAPQSFIPGAVSRPTAGTTAAIRARLNVGRTPAPASVFKIRAIRHRPQQRPANAGAAKNMQSE